MNLGGDGSRGRDNRSERGRLILRPLVLATELGTTMGFITVCTVVTGLVTGAWLDRTLGTRPLATLTCLLLSVLASLLGTMDLARSTVRRLDRARIEHITLQLAFSPRDLAHALGLVSLIVVVTLGAIAASLRLGIWLDRTLHCGPIITVVLVAVGTLGAMLAAATLAGLVIRRPVRDA